MTTDTSCHHEWEDVTQIDDPMPYRLVCIHCHALMEQRQDGDPHGI